MSARSLRLPALPAGLLALFALTVPLQPLPAAAAEPSRLDLSGFATLGAVTTDRKEVWFTRYGVNFPGDSDPDFSPDSVLGLQAAFRLSAYNDVTVQVLTREDGTEEVRPRVSLAFFRQTLAPGLSVRAGRLRVPFFMLSDSLNVNYASPWVRPPVEVYGLNPFNDLDGVDLLYHARRGELDLEVHPYYGSARIPTPQGRARLSDVWGVNVVATWGDWSVHAGHGAGDLTFVRGDDQFKALAAALRAIGLDAVVADLSGKEGRASFDSVGAQWDDGVWQVIGEYGRRRADRYAHSAHGWYLSVGRRFGALTPYLVAARQSLDRPMARADIPAGLPRLATAWEAFLTSRNNAQKSFTAGLRWDVARSAALKTELTHARPDADSWGSFFPRGDPLATRIGGRRINTLSISLDLSF